MHPFEDGPVQAQPCGPRGMVDQAGAEVLRGETGVAGGWQKDNGLGGSPGVLTPLLLSGFGVRATRVSKMRMDCRKKKDRWKVCEKRSWGRRKRGEVPGKGLGLLEGKDHPRCILWPSGAHVSCGDRDSHLVHVAPQGGEEL